MEDSTFAQDPTLHFPDKLQYKQKVQTIENWNEVLALEGLEDHYLRASKTKLVRWTGVKGGCSIDVETQRVHASTFTTLAAPGCMLKRNSKAYYELTILEYDDDATLQAGWATLAMERSDDNNEGVGNSPGSWSICVIRQVKQAT